jgi:hypothetical protein
MHRRSPRLAGPIVGLVTALTLTLMACPRPAGPRVLVVDDGVKVGADGRLLSVVELPGYLESNPAWNGSAVTLAGARGETIAFQVLVQAGDAQLRDVDVSISGLRRDGGGGGIPERQFERFREWYVKVTLPSRSPAGSAGPGEYPDALVPANTPGWGLPVDVPARRTQGVWIDCAIPAQAAAGTYRGTLRVTEGGRTLASRDVLLQVHAFELPRERHLRWRIGYSGWEEVPDRLGLPEGSEERRKLEEDLYRLVWEGHRASPTTHYQAIPFDVRGSGSALTVDWTAFDRRFGRYLDGTAFADGVPVNLFSLPVNLLAGWPGRLPDDPARVDAETLAAAARLVARHWDDMGWRLDDAFVYVADEPPKERWASVRKACEALRRGDPRIRTSVAFYTEFGRDPAALVEAFSGLVTQWDVAGDHLDVASLRPRQAAGDRIGFYQGGEPFQGGEALDDDGLALTTWPWIAWRYGLDQVFLYNMTEWSYFRLDRVATPWSGGKREIWENPLNQSWQTNGQGVLLYPGAYVGIRGVVPSLRLKQVRRGMQDYEYLWLAAREGRRDVADRVSRRLVPRALDEAGPPGAIGPFGAWARDPRAWAAGRAELARAISGPAP